MLYLISAAFILASIYFIFSKILILFLTSKYFKQKIDSKSILNTKLIIASYGLVIFIYLWGSLEFSQFNIYYFLLSFSLLLISIISLILVVLNLKKGKNIIFNIISLFFILPLFYFV